MRKLLTVCLIAGILALAGCSADPSEGITEQSGAQLQEDAARVTAERSAPASATAEEAVSSAEPTAEIQTAELPDPISLVENLGSDYLGLPDNGRVYIFRDLGKTAEISGEVCHGVSCYDEEDALVFICDFWTNSDGSRVYRQYGDDYRLLPEWQEYSGFDPETQLSQNIFTQANALYAAVYGELPYDPESAALPSDRGNYYRVTGQLDTKEKLNAALGNFFTGEILESLTDGSDNVISADDGSLYVLEHSGENISYLGTEYTLTTLTEDTAVFTGVSRFEYEAGSVTEKTIVCRAEKTPAGWRFTKFAHPYITQ